MALERSSSETPVRAYARRHSLLRTLRIVLHASVLAVLTLRSAQIGHALHPFARALANEWIHLLFYVDTVKRVPEWRTRAVVDSSRTGNHDDDDDDALVPVTLPHFLLEIEEEIAANVEDEFFGGGFAARASSYPVGMLFTIEETKQHLHGAVRNYFRLADVALDAFVLAGVADIPFPELLVRFENGSETVDASYVLTGANEREWPEPLQRDHTSPATRAFFDHLDAMRLQFIVGMQRHVSSSDAAADPAVATGEMIEWRVVLTYNLQSQGHLEVTMNYALRPRSNAEGDLEDPPAVFFGSDAAFSAALLALVFTYQAWMSCSSLTAATLSRDVWLWAILALNIATMACVVEAWRQPYALALRDALCLTFAVCCALQWLSVVRYLRASARFHILGLTLQRGLPRVAQFLAGVLPVFVGYVLFGTVMFGAHVPRFESASATATTLFAVANGDEIHDTFNAVAYAPWVGALYVYSYVMLFSYVVLMVCVGIIEDAFFSAVFPASWPSLDKTERDAAAAAKKKKQQAERRGGGYASNKDDNDEDEEEDAPLLVRA